MEESAPVIEDLQLLAEAALCSLIPTTREKEY
jgi:hypothetical protein